MASEFVCRCTHKTHLTPCVRSMDAEDMLCGECRRLLAMEARQLERMQEIRSRLQARIARIDHGELFSGRRSAAMDLDLVIERRFDGCS